MVFDFLVSEISKIGQQAREGFGDFIADVLQPTTERVIVPAITTIVKETVPVVSQEATNAITDIIPVIREQTTTIIREAADTAQQATQRTFEAALPVVVVGGVALIVIVAIVSGGRS